jgi:hypothetical protein
MTSEPSQQAEVLASYRKLTKNSLVKNVGEVLVFEFQSNRFIDSSFKNLIEED